MNYAKPFEKCDYGVMSHEMRLTDKTRKSRQMNLALLK